MTHKKTSFSTSHLIEPRVYCVNHTQYYSVVKAWFCKFWTKIIFFSEKSPTENALQVAVNGTKCKMPACLVRVLSDSVTTGFTVPLYSQYCMNLQTKKKWASENFLHMHDGIPNRSTGKMMSGSYPRSEASPPVSDALPLSGTGCLLPTEICRQGDLHAWSVGKCCVSVDT